MSSCLREEIDAETSKMGMGKKCLTNSDLELNKRIIFIRHAESKWNRAKKNNEKWKYKNEKKNDDPLLSSEGEKQAEALREWIEESSHDINQDESARILSGRLGSSSQVLSLVSNMLRAQRTAYIALRQRLEEVENEKLRIVSFLQEIPSFYPFGNFGPDLHPVAKEGKVPEGGNLLMENNYFDGRFNFGDINGKQDVDFRLKKFCKFLYMRSEQVVIAVGHSNWLKHFWKNFIPNDSASLNSLETKLKTEKIDNASVISFQLEIGPNGKCRIVPKSTNLVYGNLSSQSMKKND